MALPAWFRDLPTWAAVLSGLLGVLVLMTGLSMVLGVVFAGIAVGIEIGSLAVGVVAALLGLTIVLAPVVAAVLALSSDDAGESEQFDGERESTDPRVETLRERYLSGELDEETFERRLDDLLGDAGTDHRDSNSETSTSSERSLLDERNG
ncbi:SHOCT domain-containing protein [Natronobacterium texcoconense]|uniref:Uncharacterized membrane protein n=1 Tax=Natronobacterium texcoconense TaxID=1095778 RepID=A0A1H1GT19_NATTX|nr:hypothetical protein [Natronobacterium texcoconense]SDR16354.1 Uncharacterized membrane protein [Natronobacterium texcoconense]